MLLSLIIGIYEPDDGTIRDDNPSVKVAPLSIYIGKLISSNTIQDTGHGIKEDKIKLN